MFKPNSSSEKRNFVCGEWPWEGDQKKSVLSMPTMQRLFPACLAAVAAVFAPLPESIPSPL